MNTEEHGLFWKKIRIRENQRQSVSNNGFPSQCQVSSIYLTLIFLSLFNIDLSGGFIAFIIENHQTRNNKKRWE